MKSKLPWTNHFITSNPEKLIIGGTGKEECLMASELLSMTILKPIIRAGLGTPKLKTTEVLLFWKMAPTMKVEFKTLKSKELGK